MYIYVCTYIYVCIYIYVYIYILAHLLRTLQHKTAWTQRTNPKKIYICIYMGVCIYMYVYIYIYIYTSPPTTHFSTQYCPNPMHESCICIYIYVYIYIYIYTPCSCHRRARQYVYMYTYIHTYMYICKCHVYMCACKCPSGALCVYKATGKYASSLRVPICMNTRKHMYTCIYAHISIFQVRSVRASHGQVRVGFSSTYIHKHIQTYTHINKCIYIYIYI